MVKRSSFGSFGARPFGMKPPKVPKLQEPAAPRNLIFETRLCDAIRARVIVKLKYEDDTAYRTFEPHAVYCSTKDKYCVAGQQVDNPTDPIERDVPKNFEVGKISALQVTDDPFTPDPRFDRYDAKYANGIVCSI